MTTTDTAPSEEPGREFEDPVLDGLDEEVRAEEDSLAPMETEGLESDEQPEQPYELKIRDPRAFDFRKLCELTGQPFPARLDQKLSLGLNFSGAVSAPQHVLGSLNAIPSISLHEAQLGAKAELGMGLALEMRLSFIKSQAIVLPDGGAQWKSWAGPTHGPQLPLEGKHNLAPRRRAAVGSPQPCDVACPP
jgi:hypothetical protein